MAKIEQVDRVQQIEQAIQQLSRDEFVQLARWIQELDQERWDAQLDTDSAAGKLDFLFED